MRRRLQNTGRGTAVLVALVLSQTSGTAAQLSDPCGAACGLLLGSSSIIVATGTTAAVGHARGGFRGTREAAVIWTPVLVVTAGAGLALSGDGARQRRAVRAAALGSVVGLVTGFAIASTSGEATDASRIVATLLGGAVGALAGGVVGAVTHDDSGQDPSPPSFETSIVSVRIPL